METRNWRKIPILVLILDRARQTFDHMFGTSKWYFLLKISYNVEINLKVS